MAKKRKTNISDTAQEVMDWVGHKSGAKAGIGSAIGIVQSLKNKEIPKLSDAIGVASKSPMGQALSLTAKYGEKDKENFKTFADKKNKGKKLSVKPQPRNNVAAETTGNNKKEALKNAKNFVKK